jgi:hypothetical protein
MCTHLPVSEPPLLNLDLLREPLPQCLFLFLELGVIKLPRSCFAELPRLHLLSSVGLVVILLSCVNEVKHVSADKDASQLLEVAVVLILDFSNTPGVLATLDDAAIRGLDIFLGADDGERHGVHESAGVLGSGLVIFLNGRLVDLNALGFDNRSDAGLEARQVGRGQGVSFGDNGNEVDTRAEALHDFDIERLQGVASGSNEVEAGVYTEVDFVSTAGLLLLQHVGLVLVVKELDDGHPRVAVVDIVAKAWGVDHGETNWRCKCVVRARWDYELPLKNFSSSSAFVISISTVLSTCLACRLLWSV